VMRQSLLVARMWGHGDALDVQYIHVGYFDGGHKLRACWWVTVLKCLHFPVYSDVVVCCARFVDGVGESSQFEGLANGSNGVLYSACFDLLALANVASSNPLDECLNDRNLFFVM